MALEIGLVLTPYSLTHQSFATQMRNVRECTRGRGLRIALVPIGPFLNPYRDFNSR